MAWLRTGDAVPRGHLLIYSVRYPHGRRQARLCDDIAGCFAELLEAASIHLNDITVDAAYSASCGYTEADLDRVFMLELAGLDREQIRAWDNGCNWIGRAVYNRFDHYSSLPITL